MAQSPAEVVLPSGQHGDAERGRTPPAALLVAQSLVDLCLAERVEQALHAAGYPPLRGVEVSVSGPLVILRGQVHSFYMKQLAQAVALEVTGVRELRNAVQVVGLAQSGPAEDDNGRTA